MDEIKGDNALVSPLVAMVGGTPQDQERAMQNGADAYLNWPVNVRDYRAFLKKHLGPLETPQSLDEDL